MSRYLDKKSGPWILAAAKLMFGTLAISLKLLPTPVVLLALSMHVFGAIGSFPKAWKDLRQLSWPMIVKIGTTGLAIAATDITYFYALRLMDVSVTTLVRWVAPVLLAAGVFLFTKQKNTKTVLATLAAFFGLVLLLNGNGLTFDSANLFGLALALLSAISVAIYWFSTKQLLHHTTPLVVLCVRSIVAVALFLPFVNNWSAVSETWWQILLFGLVYGLLASYLDTVGIQRTPVAYVGLVGYLVPLTSVIGATIILNETITPLMILGGTIILGSGLWAQRT